MRRLAWLLILLAVGALGVVALYLASWPMYHFNDCELGLGDDWAGCQDSLLDERGGGYVVAMLLPAAVCAVPVAFPARSFEWGAAGTLVAGAVVAFATVGGAAVLLAATAALAVALAASRGRFGGSNPEAAELSGTEFFDRVRDRQAADSQDPIHD